MLREVQAGVKNKLVEFFINKLPEFFEVHCKRKIGFMIGFFIGIMILAIGPFDTFFMFFCGVIGLYIGSRFDEGDDLVGKTLKAIENALPERFRR